MTATAIYAGRILTPQEELLNNVIVVEAGRITGIGHRDEVHIPPGAKDYVAAEMTVVPGFVDVHIHGAGGHDVMEATPQALDAITSTVARFGTTSIVATTVTAPVDETCRSLEGIASYVRSHEKTEENTRAAAEIVGVHLEGPFINKARRGVHPPESVATPSIEMLEQFRAAADGLVKIVTVAPCTTAIASFSAPEGLLGVEHRHPVRAAGRPGHPGQVGLGLEADVEIVGLGRGAFRVDQERGELGCRPAAVVVDDGQRGCPVPPGDPLGRGRHTEQERAVSREAHDSTFGTSELSPYGAAASPAQGTAAGPRRRSGRLARRCSATTW